VTFPMPAFSRRPMPGGPGAAGGVNSLRARNVAQAACWRRIRGVSIKPGLRGSCSLNKRLEVALVVDGLACLLAEGFLASVGRPCPWGNRIIRWWDDWIVRSSQKVWVLRLVDISLPVG